MQLGSDTQIRDGLLAESTLLREKPRLGFERTETTVHQASIRLNYLNGNRVSSTVVFEGRQVSLMAQQQSSPLTDKNGNVVQGANGKPALIPNGFDVGAVVQSGKGTGDLRKVAPMVGAKATAEDLANFGRGGKWDLQRLSGNFDPRYIDSATILIGMYAAASNITRNQILDIENTVARGSTYAKGTVMDSTYTHLPVRNVTNTDIGMRLVQSGSYVP
jgi:hypothetical protein